MNQTTLDQIELEQMRKRQQQAKTDSKTKEKVEILDDKKADTYTKGQLANIKTEKSIRYFRAMIQSQESKKDREKQQVEEEFERKYENLKADFDNAVKKIEDKKMKKLEIIQLNYQQALEHFSNNLQALEVSKMITEQTFKTQRERTERKKTHLANTIKTDKIKKEAEELLEKQESSSDSESSVESVKQPEPESESEEETPPPPPPKPIKMAAKMLGSKSQEQPKIITNTKREQPPDPVLIQAQKEREIVSELDVQLRNNNDKRVRTQALLKAERCKINPDEDKIDQYERELDFLKDERFNLTSRMPKGFRTSIG